MNAARVLGTGSHVVICLNGWFGYAGDWGPWEKFLDTETFTWVFPDYRGYGSRKDEAGDFTLEEVSDDALSVVKDIKANLRFKTITVLGHSMGGAFAQHLIMSDGEDIDAFVGISSVPASGSPMPPEQRELFEAAETDLDARRTIIDITTGGRLSGRWLDQMADLTQQHSTDSAVGGYFQAWADCSFLGQLGAQSMPALVIVGAHDPAVTVDSVQSSYGKVFENLVVVEYPDTGHYEMFEAPLRLATDIENFLKAQFVGK